MAGYGDPAGGRGDNSYSVCGSEVDDLSWLTTQVMAVSRAVNQRRR